MRTLITSGTVVTGDGRTVLPNATVVLKDRVIEAIEPSGVPTDGDFRVVDASGCLVIPGLVNAHTHGVTPGPLFPSAASALPDQRWLEHLDGHLLSGTTTVLNLCGFSTMDEVHEADRRHAVHVRGATTHFATAMAAAQAADGAGLRPEHLATGVEHMLAAGAVAIGEVGGGQTMGGGGQELHYLPQAFHRATGVSISPTQARRLKEAALGTRLDPRVYRPSTMAAALADAGLDGVLTTSDAREVVTRSVMPSFALSLQAMRDGVAAAARYGVPVLVHSAAASASVLRELAVEHPGGTVRVVACHSNHPTLTPDEAVDLADDLAASGWVVEACTFDLLHERHTVTTRDHWDRLFDSVDVGLVATDYGFEGRHDPLIAAVQDLVDHGRRSLPQAVALVTSLPARAVPGLAPDRGELAPGKVADVVVTRQADLRDVRHVFMDGVPVVQDARLTEQARP